MPNKPKSVLIASLGRSGGGFAHYNANILKYFTLPYTLIQSSYIIPEDRIPSATFIPTYRGKLSFVFNSLFLLPFIFIKIYFLAKKYDVLFLPHFHFWNLAFILAFRARKKPVVLVEHDGIVHLGDELPIQQLLINACLKHSTHLVFLTHYVKSLVHPSLLAGKHISIIPHGIYVFKGLQTTPKVYHPKPTLLFFGRVSKYKGVELLLDSLATLPLDCFEKLIIAGKSSYEYDISHLPYGLQEKLQIIDEFLPQDRIAELFNHSQILILPYLEASQSGVAAIGIANCIPTICTDVGGLKEQFILTFNGGGGE